MSRFGKALRWHRRRRRRASLCDLHKLAIELSSLRRFVTELTSQNGKEHPRDAGLPADSAPRLEPGQTDTKRCAATSWGTDNGS